jgi:hypothetical protein
VKSGLIFRDSYAILLGLILLIALNIPVSAQSDDVTDGVLVPDVRGMRLPIAAAALNGIGLALGEVTLETWTHDSGVDYGTVGAQSPMPQDRVEPGSAVDLTVRRMGQIVLIYDADSFTLVNQSGAQLDTTAIEFVALEGDAQFFPTHITNRLEDGGCLQLWSVNRVSADWLLECDNMRWIRSMNALDFFWHPNPGARFVVRQSGADVALCGTVIDNVPQQRCVVNLETPYEHNEIANYVYFAYTADQFALANVSRTQWMPVAEVLIQAGENTIPVGAADLYGNHHAVADLTRLAPGQCLLLTSTEVAEPLPVGVCSIIGFVEIEPDAVFWTEAFEVDAGEQMGGCLPAAVNAPTTCTVER